MDDPPDLVLVDESDAGSEELGQPPDRFGTRTRTLLVLAAAVLILALILVRFHTAGDGAVRTARAARPASSTAPHRVGVPDAGNCPQTDNGVPLCEIAAQVPRPVVAALRDAYPRARLVGSVEVHFRLLGASPGAVWFRQLHATRGAQRISVVVRRARSIDHESLYSGSDARGSVVTAQRVIGPVTVLVRVDAPSDRLTTTAPLRALVGDARLLTTP